MKEFKPHQSSSKHYTQHHPTKAYSITDAAPRVRNIYRYTCIFSNNNVLENRLYSRYMEFFLYLG